MNLEQRSLDRIAKEFAPGQQPLVIEILSSYSGPEPDRLRWNILQLSKGSLEKVQQYLQNAQTDYRDILYWAEYYDKDPLLRGRDPKKLVDDILNKLGRDD